MQIDVHKMADAATFNRFHAGILAWCAVIIICDGYDVAVAGIALPSIMKQMGVTPQSAGFMVSSALFGMMVGGVVLGTVADRIGRLRAIAVCLALFSVFNAAAGLATDPYVFSAMRFLAGLGMGGVMPNVVAHMTEYSPKKIRATMVTLMFSGYAVGGMIAALVGKGMIESHGWASVFQVAGAPFVLIPFVLRGMPESMPFLISRGRHRDLQRILVRMQPGYRTQADDAFVLASADRVQGAPFGKLFQDGRGFSTVMFWIAFFMCLFMVYALSSWLAKLMAGAGHSLGSALTLVLVLNFGAMIGAVGGGWLADRFSIKYVLIGMYLLAAMSITLLGYPVPAPALFLLVGMAGACTIGTQIVTYAYAGQYYPMAVRSTGIGWASGVGRGGAILGPIIMGTLVGMSLPIEQNFMAISIPAVIAAVAVSLIHHGRSATRADPTPGQALADPSEA
jgi:AAHS family benzoate transporter-like MFS transporter